MNERILIVGSGAREHAIGWKIAQHSHGERELFFAPGNGGTAQIGTNVNIESTDTDRLLAFAKDNKIGLTAVGPERPLAEGIVNSFRAEGMPIFGHTQEAAILESDKAEAVLFLRRHNIPHPRTEIFTDPRAAEAFVQNNTYGNIVIKASGLAEGKGVVLPDTNDEANTQIRRIMDDRAFGDAGKKIVIQERLVGKEVSVIGFVSNRIGLLVPAQDYKRVYDGDLGPNTGGMGAYSPNTNLTEEQLQEVYRSILLPTKEGMEQEGRPLTGAIYVGLMITEDGIKVIEYNVRFGDPETQVQMRLLKSDLLEAMQATVDGTLESKHYRSSKRSAVGVVVASKGYPWSFEVGNSVKIDDVIPDDIVIFHGGTRQEERDLVTSGGRVLTVTATGKTPESASRKIYKVLEEGKVLVVDGFYRNDIGK